MADKAPSSSLTKRGVHGRILWTTLDQIVSSATNAAVSFLVARQLGASEFGSFAVAFIAFAFVSGLARAVVTDPLLIRFSAANDEARRRAVGDAAGAMMVAGAVSSLVCAMIGFNVPELTGSVLVALAIVLPGLLLQTAWRQSFFASGQPRAAFVNDSAWAIMQIGGLAAVELAGGGSAIELMLIWGAAAAVAAVLGAVQAGTRPHLRGGVAWLRTHRDLGARFGTEFALSQGAANLTMILVGVVATITAVGSIRGAQVLLGPVMVLFLSITAFALPLLSKHVALGGRITRLSVAIGGVAGGLTLLWTLLLLLLPAALGRELLGATWQGAREVLAFSGLQWVAIGIASGATLGLKAYGRATTLLRLTLIQAPLMIVLGISGAYLADAQGAVCGLAIAQLVGVVLNWAALLRIERANTPRPGRHRKTRSGS